MSAPLASSATAIPHRKQIRQWLIPVSERSTALALALSAIDLSLFALLIVAVVVAEYALVKLLVGIVLGFVIGRLFILGHDACHHSFTRNRRLNRSLGRIVMLPSLTPYSLWDIGHNVVHHGYTNLKGFDFVWSPKTLDEYSQLPAWRRALERVYRSGWAPGLYYLVEIWWLRLFFPSRRYMPTQRRIFTLDSMLVLAFALAWITGLIVVARMTDQSALWLCFTGFVVPQLFWNTMIGFVVYVHHTHSDIAWHDDKQRWGEAQPFVSTTVHLRFSKPLGIDWGALIHHINEHTAHHVDMSIPLYRLREAQRILEEKMPGRIVNQPFSWHWYFRTARRCKLYDYEHGRWIDFFGRPTSRAQKLIAARAGS